MEVRELDVSEGEEAARVVARGMRDNPIDIAVWPLDEESRQRALVRLYRAVFRHLFVRGCVLGAFEGATLVGACGMAAPGRCQLSLLENLRFVPSVLCLKSPVAPVRLIRVETHWAQRDPAEAHWHLGPVAVDAHLQGHGIGSQMLAAFSQRMDTLGALAYLETDKERNVCFYEKFGFRASGESEVLGVRCWYMTRVPRVAHR